MVRRDRKRTFVVLYTPLVVAVVWTPRVGIGPVCGDGLWCPHCRLLSTRSQCLCTSSLGSAALYRGQNLYSGIGEPGRSGRTYAPRSKSFLLLTNGPWEQGGQEQTTE